MPSEAKCGEHHEGGGGGGGGGAWWRHTHVRWLNSAKLGVGEESGVLLLSGGGGPREGRQRVLRRGGAGRGGTGRGLPSRGEG